MATQTQSQKILNAALFSEYVRGTSFANMLTGKAPTQVVGKASQRQTEAHAPIVRVTNLQKEAGDAVEVDVMHQLRGKPTMGDRKLEGRSESLTQANMEMKIDQTRHVVDTGGRMTRKRTKHDLKAAARTLLGDNYMHTLNDERVLYHLAGARGSLLGADDIVPLATDDEFDDIMINPLMPPTYDRHVFGGDADAIDSLDAADVMSLEAIEKLALIRDETRNMRIPSVQFEGDKAKNDDPFHVLWVTPRQMFDLEQQASTKEWQQMAAAAMNRGKWFQHPLFIGDCYYWKGILIKKLKRSVAFSAGDTVGVSQNNNNATVAQATPGVNVHRAIFMGGNALAHALGNAGKDADGKGSDGYMGMHEEPTDHGNAMEISIRMCDGMKKIRFKDKDGRLNDNGVMVLDTAVSG